MTIRTRLTLWYSALLATVILVFGVSLFSLLNWAWYSQLQDSMRVLASQVVKTITVDRMTGDIAQTDIQKQLGRLPYFSFAVQVWRRDGTLVAWTGNLRDYSEPFDHQNLFSEREVLRDLPFGDEKGHVLVSTIPVHSPTGEHIGAVQILAPLATLEAATERLLRVMIGVGVVALVLSFMVGSVIAAQALQPIEVISNAAKQITAADDLSRRIPFSGPPDELGQLTQTFNMTLERLERLFVAQRRFVADVSHEMRTPLTIIQGNLDLIKRVGLDQRSLEAMESETKRMTRLVGDLLLLAQADSGVLPPRESPVEVDTLVLEVYRQAKVIAEAVEVKLEISQPMRVMGDPDRLKQLLLNLVTNAIKYTPPGGVVTLRLTQENGYAFISVKDTGMGIPKEDLPHIFERFYRVDKARAREMGGVGLGLSIAKWIAEAHRGRIWVESEVGKGSTFTVQLPCIDMETPPESTRETRPRMPILRRKE